MRLAIHGQRMAEAELMLQEQMAEQMAEQMTEQMAAQVAEKMVEQMQMAEPAPMPQAHQLFRRRETDRRLPRSPPRTSGSSSAA